ncbi:hypothetical protein D9756_008175 [Leucocoprinus leucothites]|uniref:Uncharacterized protein n=1 Tax=Leucocoprinus leucothites TaxID=201217 RepID=A0A8H5FVV3_9AGAR|nr:hypothetical protein D9756_008175 [Leucoagaricus leucothites]
MSHSNSFAGASNFQVNDCHFYHSSGDNNNFYYAFQRECSCPHYPWLWAAPPNFVVDASSWYLGVPPHHLAQPMFWSSHFEQEYLTFGTRFLAQPYTFHGAIGSWPSELRSIPLYSVSNITPHWQPPSVLEPIYSGRDTQRQTPRGVHTSALSSELEQAHIVSHTAPLLSLNYPRNNDTHAHRTLRDGLQGGDYGQIPGQPCYDDSYSAPACFRLS